MQAPWDETFDGLVRAALPDLAVGSPLDPDRPLIVYGLGSLDFAELAAKLSAEYGIALGRFTLRAFRTAGSLWSFVSDASTATVAPARASAAARAAGRRNLLPSLAQLFAATAEQHPDSACLLTDEGAVSYAEMDRAARALAEIIGAQPGRRVAVLGERAEPMYRAYLAVLYAGATVVPLGADSPPARNATMTAEAGADLVLVADDTGDPVVAEHCAAIAAARTTATFLHLAELTTRQTAGPDARSAAFPVAPSGPDELAYLLFTSGSTGKPKGVGISHRNMAAYLSATAALYRLGPGDAVFQAHELTFDLSVGELWQAWSRGAAAHVVSRIRILDPAPAAAEHGAKLWICTPSLVEAVIRTGRLEPLSLPSLRHIVSAGELLTRRTLAALRQAAPNAAIDNAYGPTETTIWCTSVRFPAGKGIPPGAHGVEIGRPLDGVETLVLAEGGTQDVPEGELCLSGPQVFGGYEDAEQTGEKIFALRGRRWYRTGDRVRRNADGTMSHLGRLDDQVKVRGFRVELGEVEAVASGLLGGRATAAVTVPDCAGLAQLALFVEGGDDEADTELLRAELAEALPPYMVPRRVYTISRLPLNASAKLDRSRLAELAHGGGR